MVRTIQILFTAAVFLLAAVAVPNCIAQEGAGAADNPAVPAPIDFTPVVLLVIGIVSVLGLIIGIKMNAFLALIISALIVSLGVGYFVSDPAEIGRRAHERGRLRVRKIGWRNRDRDRHGGDHRQMHAR